MQVVLTKDVLHLGKKWEIKRVKDGYFRNYLYPRSMAVLATSALLKQAEEKMKKMMIEKEELKKKAVEVKERLEALTLVFEKKASAKGKLFGSISEKDIAEKIKEEANVELKEEQILMKEHIKAVGQFSVNVQLTENIQAEIKIEVKTQE